MHLDVLKAFCIRQLLARRACVRVFPNRFRYISSNFIIDHNIFAVYYRLLYLLQIRRKTNSKSKTTFPL